ncbi:heavy-metal-associated domain-containing protein [Ornithinibacillus halophilus]|nr:heavy metal-associated domain-containing protein [Ornithinibacillus halophilus]
MKETTIFVKEAVEELSIQKIEKTLMDQDGIERVLIDTDDGEIKIHYNEKHINHEQLIVVLEERGFHLN